MGAVAAIRSLSHNETVCTELNDVGTAQALVKLLGSTKDKGIHLGYY